ncbi:MAG: response regulator [Verrucomicrobiales bacterium]|nr:response regulator [Verrucomicrobiales bacterium]
MATVLIVDDREEARYLLESILASRGFRVVSTRNGAEALESAKLQVPDLVISDLLMPVMDGYTLLQRWRSQPSTASVPFIVYTATYTDPRDEALAMNLGATVFLPKPSEPDALLRTIDDALQRAKSSPAGAHSAASPQAPSPTPVPGAECSVKVLQQYNQVLIHKLEDKMEQAERALRELERDVGRRRAVEERLRESERKYRELVEHANCIILRWTKSGEITFLNEFGQRFFGYSEEEILHRNIIGTVVAAGESTGRDLRPLMRRIGEDPKSFEQNINENICRDGRRVWIEWTNKAVLNDHGEVVEILSIGRDITDQRRLEEQFREAQKLEAVGLLAAGVAHDFNNILTVIQGSAHLLLHLGTHTGEGRELLQQIIGASERAAMLTNQLLVFSRRQVMNRGPVNPNVLVTDLAKMIERMIGESIHVCTDCSASIPSVFADRLMLEQALLNLAVNARDAMPSGGTLRISTSVRTINDPADCRNPQANTGSYVALTVSDTGHGIPDAILPRIFDPFFTTKEIGKGTGLGLAAVHGIARQHGGWVEVTTAIGQGTRFAILLPSSGPMSADSPEPNPAESEIVKGYEHVLVVEDDDGVRTLVCSLLQKCGYQVIAARSGSAALELWREHAPQIEAVLTDLVMPGPVSGFDLADRLKAERPGLPVIFMSGYSAELSERRSELTEGLNLLQKPFSAGALARAIRAALDRRPNPANDLIQPPTGSPPS